VLRDGEPAAVDVEIGVSDGRRTQVVKGDIAPGTPLIVDTVTSKGGT
jgi:HlyD family secretion protein